MRTAEKACAKYQEAIKPPELSDEEQAEFKQAALENARCMRENGVEKFPDPTFDENGGAQIRMGKGMGIDPEDPAFQKAMKACEDTMPMGGKTPRAGASDEARARRCRRGGGRRGRRARGARRRRDAGHGGAARRGRARPPRWSEPTSSTARTCPARSATRTPGTLAAGVSGTLTGLREPGTVVTRGHSLYSVDGEPAAFLLYGALPAWRDFASGMTDGEDVRQLERNLRALGYDPGHGRRRLGLGDDRRREGVPARPRPGRRRHARRAARSCSGTARRGSARRRATVGESVAPGRPVAAISSVERRGRRRSSTRAASSSRAAATR